MSLRDKLSVTQIASIEHLHSADENNQLVAMIRAGGIAPPGLDDLLAHLIESTRSRGATSLEDIKNHIGMSSRRMSDGAAALMREGFIKRCGAGLVVAPFSMKWGSNGHRLIVPHFRGPNSWSWFFILDRLIKRPGPGDEPNEPKFMSPRWRPLAEGGPSHVNRSSSRDVARATQYNSSGPSHVNRSSSRDVAGASPAKSGPSHVSVIYTVSNKKVSKRVSSLLRKELAAVASATSADALDEVSQSTIIRDEVKTARRKTMDDDWGLEPELLEEDAPATQALAEPSCERKRATALPQEESATSCTDKPKAVRKRDRTPEPKKGEDDPNFMKVWTTLLAAHQAEMRFSDAGIGSRNHAWAAWGSQLTKDEMAAAAANVERYVAFQKARGYKLQQASWWIKDRSWKRVPSDFRPGQTAALVQPRPAAPPAVTRDPWRFGVELLLSKGNAAGLPGNLDLAVFASWPDESRDRFVALVREIEPSGSKRLKAISLRAYAACYPSDADAEPVRPEMLAASAKAIVGGASLQLRGPLARSRHRPMSQEEISAYCRSVGVSDTPTRFSRLR